MYEEERNAIQRRFTRWMAQYHTLELIVQAEEIPPRQDMVTLLHYVQENKVVGTQSTGNMPLKAVREVTAQFVHPPQLDFEVGDHTYRLRSARDVWDLYLLHALADVGGLLQTAPARRWRVTPLGEKFLNTGPLLQATSLLATWWYQVNWLIAYPFVGMGEALPQGFQGVALQHLLSFPVETRIDYTDFADSLIKTTGLTWTTSGEFVQSFLRSAVQRMIIRVVEDFQGITCEYTHKPLGSGIIPKLQVFEITPLGRVLLEGVVIMGG